MQEVEEGLYGIATYERYIELGFGGSHGIKRTDALLGLSLLGAQKGCPTAALTFLSLSNGCLSSTVCVTVSLGGRVKVGWLTRLRLAGPVHLLGHPLSETVTNGVLLFEPPLEVLFVYVDRYGGGGRRLIGPCNEPTVALDLLELLAW